MISEEKEAPRIAASSSKPSVRNSRATVPEPNERVLSSLLSRSTAVDTISYVPFPRRYFSLSLRTTSFSSFSGSSSEGVEPSPPFFLAEALMASFFRSKDKKSSLAAARLIEEKSIAPRSKSSERASVLSSMRVLESSIPPLLSSSFFLIPTAMEER